MPPRSKYQARKTLKVVRFKGGKAVRKSQLTVPLRYSMEQASNFASSSSSASTSGEGFQSLGGDDQENAADFPTEFPSKKKPRLRKVKLRKKLKAYHERKSRLAASWLNIRQQLVSALLGRQTLPAGQKCVIPSCSQVAKCK